MAEETGYRRQVRPQARAAMPQAPSFADGLGREIQRAGEVLHAEQIETYESGRRATKQEETARFQRGFVDVREAIGAVSREARKDGSPGHAARVREAYTARREELLAGITEDDVRARSSEMFEEFGLRLFEQEANFEEARRAESTLTNWSETEDISNNRMYRLDNHEDYLTELEIRHAAVDGLDIAQSDKDKAHREVDQSGTWSFAKGRGEADPGLLRAMIDQGLFDDALAPEQLEALRRDADIGIRALQVAARREEAERAAMLREEAATLLQRVGNGLEIDDAQFALAIEGATALGDTSLAEQLAGARADNGFARIYRDATPLQLEQRLGALAGKGDASESEQRELAWLRPALDSRRSDFDRDPAAFLMEKGGGPQVDFANPDSLAQRGAWARAQSRATGRHVPILTRSEAAPLADALERGDELRVLATLDRFADPFDRVDAAQVIAPNDATFHRLAVMPREYRATMRAGEAALKANPKLLKPAQEYSQGAQHLERWELQLRRALREIDPADAEAVVQVARMEMAGRLSRHPGETIDTQGDAFFGNAMQRALGAEVRAGVRYGGLGRWSGGHPFIVSEGLTQEQWVQRARGDRDRQRQAGTGPVNPDGSPFDLNRAYPVFLGGNVYRWQTEGGATVKNAAGGAYITQIGSR